MVVKLPRTRFPVENTDFSLHPFIPSSTHSSLLQHTYHTCYLAILLQQAPYNYPVPTPTAYFWVCFASYTLRRIKEKERGAALPAGHIKLAGKSRRHVEGNPPRSIKNNAQQRHESSQWHWTALSVTPQVPSAHHTKIKQP